MRASVIPALAILLLLSIPAFAADKPANTAPAASLTQTTAPAAASAAAPAPALATAADGSLEQKLILKDHVFTPSSFSLPPDQKVKLTIDNQDSTAEEFDSHDLKREKVVAANSSASFVVGPLKAGTYKYEGEFHSGSAKGVITVK